MSNTVIHRTLNSTIGGFNFIPKKYVFLAFLCIENLQKLIAGQENYTKRFNQFNRCFIRKQNASNKASSTRILKYMKSRLWIDTHPHPHPPPPPNGAFLRSLTVTQQTYLRLRVTPHYWYRW